MLFPDGSQNCKNLCFYSAVENEILVKNWTFLLFLFESQENVWLSKEIFILKKNKNIFSKRYIWESDAIGLVALEGAQLYPQSPCF